MGLRILLHELPDVCVIYLLCLHAALAVMPSVPNTWATAAMCETSCECGKADGGGVSPRVGDTDWVRLCCGLQDSFAKLHAFTIMLFVMQPAKTSIWATAVLPETWFAL